MSMAQVWGRSAPTFWQRGFVAAALIAGLAQTGTAQLVTKAPISGEIDHLLLNDSGDTWSGGYIVVGGQNVIIPRNLLIDLPANRLSLQQLFAAAPKASRNLGESGLALSDLTARGRGAHAEIHANRMPSGNIIAGEIFIAKGIEEVTGEVTFIDWDDGYLRVNGDAGSDDTGVMIRINDPTGRYSIQKGKGCRGGPNCSPDPRFGVDTDNYTVTFMTGYPACLPSTTILRNRTGYIQGVDPASAGADNLGENDPWCPCDNRDTSPVPDSTKFAPILLGDAIAAEGNFERVKGTRFLSAHTITVFDKLMTLDDPTQPDYMIFSGVGWPLAGYPDHGMEVEFGGYTTLPDSQLDIFKLHVDPATGDNHESVLATTFGNPDMVHAGIFPNETGIFAGEYHLSFIFENEVFGLPCINVMNGGLPACDNPTAAADNFAMLHPVPREIIGRTRHKADLLPGVITRDLQGNQSPNGEYLTPVELDHPDFALIDLARQRTPFIFAGTPWLLDRRLSPGGCDGPCDGAPQPLDPFPFSGLDPRTQGTLPIGVEDVILSYWPFGPADFLAWPPTDPAGSAILPTPDPVLPCEQPLIIAEPSTGGALIASPKRGKKL